MVELAPHQLPAVFSVATVAMPKNTVLRDLAARALAAAFPRWQLRAIARASIRLLIERYEDPSLLDWGPTQACYALLDFSLRRAARPTERAAFKELWREAARVARRRPAPATT